jgi:ABC-type dipeptide/oligopeptide/nickel transport system permease component
VQTVVLLISATFVTINVVVDLLYRWLDPRVDLA